MLANLPLSTVILEILKHTPTYVWAILAGLIVLGSLQLRDNVVTRARLALAPLALGTFSIWGATHAFGVRVEVIAAWAIGMAIVVAANRRLQWPTEVRHLGAGRFALRGSAWPLVTMLTIFSLRYAVAVTLAFHHDWAADPLFSTSMALIYGAVSGFFTARVLRILGSAGASGALAAA
jgi:hypothetical protein